MTWHLRYEKSYHVWFNSPLVAVILTDPPDTTSLSDPSGIKEVSERGLGRRGFTMDFTAQLDVDVVALEAEDEVTCLVSLTAPVPDGIADRPGGRP